MEPYSTTYKFTENGIGYEAKISGVIFDKANEEINFYSVSHLRKGLVTQILTAILAISDEQNGMFVNEAQLMQSNANDAYAVLINGDLLPISMDVTIKVTSIPFELLK